ncbi:hypothetical protein HY932_02575 [Candidatus Falkowbacteria bacterium]|nr:hypothetical protein [Candidatus Falkowbacteria bacterium]
MPWIIQLNFSWLDLANKSFLELIWYFIANGGWILLAMVCAWGSWKYWVFWRQGLFASKQSYVFLAIDIPKNNIQSPKAVENMFATIAGSHTPTDWWEKYMKGEFQIGFSFEIISIDGHIQYVIRTPVPFRQLVEASIYSQYPEAEITEVEDYTLAMDIKFPHDEYNLWGSDLDLYAPDYLPIRTYPEFEHQLSQEIKDPLAAVLEVMATFGPGEQLWFQIFAAPADVGWEAKGIKRINQLLGKKEESNKNLLDKITDVPLNVLTMASDQILGVSEPEKKKEERMMYFLPPIEKAEVDMIQKKVSKVGYNCKARMIYVAKKEVFKKGLGVSGTFGSLKQFSILGGNGFKPGANKTRALFFKNLRLPIMQNRILEVYKKRNPDTGKGLYTLNIEELASLYHFPYMEVKAATLKKVDSKKVSAPIGLPIDEGLAPKKIPAELLVEEPLIVEKIPIVDYDDDYFESRFAKDKTGKADRERKEKIMESMRQEKK